MKNNTHGMKACGPREGTIAHKIERYVTDNPDCTKADIVTATGISRNTVAMTLTRLSAVGLVHKVVKLIQKGRKQIRVSNWSPGMGEGAAPVALPQTRTSIEGMPRQKIVKKWASQKFQHDEIAVALFGISQQKQQGGILN